MKVDKNSIIRIEKMINSDRLKSADGFVDLLTGDIDRVLKDYFDYKGYPAVAVSKNGSSINISISLTAERIRAFSVLPTEQ
ncbi:MAG: hypothetical protein J5911_03070 [Clostridia bacterium]|nr:hypothetical protein [Clostridia bacterium]